MMKTYCILALFTNFYMFVLSQNNSKPIIASAESEINNYLNHVVDLSRFAVELYGFKEKDSDLKLEWRTRSNHKFTRYEIAFSTNYFKKIYYTCKLDILFLKKYKILIYI